MRKRLCAAAAGVCLAAASLAFWHAWPAHAVIEEWAPDYEAAAPHASDAAPGGPAYDLVARPPDNIPPGTVVDRGPPPGWSHLVIKSLPRLRAGEEAAFPLVTRGETARMASWMFTAFLANVVRDEAGGWRFSAVGLGLGTAVDGRDMVLTAPSASKFHARLGIFGGEVLTKGYDVQSRAVMPIRGPSLAVLDTPVWFRKNGENRLVRYRYNLLVDRATGRIDVVMWSLGATGDAAGETEMAVIAPNTIDVAELVVDRRKVNAFGVPGDDAFAVDRLPTGRRVAFPADLRPLAARTRFTQQEARSLEARLRSLFP